MRMFFACWIAFSPLISLADDRRDAEGALALAIAQKQLAPTRQATYSDEAKARAEAIRTGRPLLTRYGSLDCSSVCSEVDAVVCHVATGEPRMRIAVYQPGAEPYWWYFDWDRVPSTREVREAIDAIRKKMASTPPIPAAKAKLDWQI